MQKLDDYYRILQVHYLAETEVIEGAYRKLAKKYHPDLNRSASAEEMIKKINRAYEELGDPAKRKLYDQKWHNRYNSSAVSHQAEPKHKPQAQAKPEPAYLAAWVVLEAYFKYIMDDQLDLAYELTSNADKHNNSKEDFFRWQKAVAKVFRPKEVVCSLHKAYKYKMLNGYIFAEAIEFSVHVLEYNTIMDTMEKDYFSKIVVLEEGKWKILIGHENVRTLIDRFNSLVELMQANCLIQEMEAAQSKIDALTGLLSKKGMLEKIKEESYRFTRYGRIFSLMTLEVSTEPELNDLAMKAAGKILSAGLRRIDTICRWDNKVFLILLPETTGAQIIRAAHSKYRKLKDCVVEYHGKSYPIFLKIGAVEYTHSLEESFKRIKYVRLSWD